MTITFINYGYLIMIKSFTLFAKPNKSKMTFMFESHIEIENVILGKIDWMTILTNQKRSFQIEFIHLYMRT